MRRASFVVWLLVVVVATGSVQAGFVSALTGNSDFSGSRGGYVNWAVYENVGGVTGNWITDLGLGAVVTDIPGLNIPPVFPPNPGATGGERNVFFYQITRSDTGDGDAITDFTAPFHDVWTSIGYLAGTVFSDAGSPVLGSGALGTSLNTLGAAALGGKTVGVAGPTFVGDGAAVDPATTLGTLDNGGGEAQFYFTATPLVGGDHSSVFFVTSTSNPLTTVTDIPTLKLFEDGSVTGALTMEVPVSNPEPGSLALLSVAMVVGTGGSWWRRRRRRRGEKDKTSDSDT